MNNFLKRGFDLFVSLSVLILLSPLFLLISLCIWKQVFYRGLRIGHYFKPFYMYKFRTMEIDTDKFGANTPSNDKRITRVGKILRRTKIDELPQFINVLKGEMSLVGYRPEVPEYCMLYPNERIIFTVKPGMTDYASIWDINEGELLKSGDPEKIYLEQIRPEKIRLQRKYITEQSFCTDIKILFMTFKKLLI